MRATAAIVLAAGASTRLGEPKQLVILAGETLLDRAVRTAAQAGCAPVVVVLGAQSEQIRANATLAGAQVIVNADWQEGMASSIRLGIGALADVGGAVILTCDQPLISAAHLQALFERDPAAVTASAYAGRRGVPAYFPTSRFNDLRALVGDAGARAMLQDAAAIVCADAAWDVDTPAALDSVKRLV